MAGFRGESLVGVLSRDLRGEEVAGPSSLEVRKCPLDLEDCGRSLIFTLGSLVVERASSSRMV